jgi:uncharacterized protein involved in response to NO
VTRVTLGHTGRDLRAGRGTTALYLLVILAARARIAAGMPGLASGLWILSQTVWFAAFTGFKLLYAGLLRWAKTKV